MDKDKIKEKIKSTPADKVRIMILDLGTTNTKVKIFDNDNNELVTKKRLNKIIKPSADGSEIDGNVLWTDVVDLCKECMDSADLKAQDVTCMGITVQRESFFLWDRKTGDPLNNIITWQDRRSESICNSLNSNSLFLAYKLLCRQRNAFWSNKASELSSTYIFKPHMTSSRLHWLLKNNAELEKKTNDEQTLYGTVDSWIAYKLTNGVKHITDYASASITGLYDSVSLEFHNRMISNLLRLPFSMFPSVVPTHGILFETNKDVFGDSIPVTCMIGDQQASTFGCGCTTKCKTKATLGTGLFVDTFLGQDIIPRIVEKSYPLIGWVDETKNPCYVYETRSDFANMKLYELIQSGVVADMEALEKLVTSKADQQNDSTKAIKEQALEILNDTIFTTYQTLTEYKDNVKPICEIDCIYIDGGYSSSDYLLQAISSMTNLKIIRMEDKESTSRGALYLARLGAGLNTDISKFATQIRYGKVFEPIQTQREQLRKLFKIAE